MSGESLREALEKRLGTLPVMAYGNGYMVEALPKAELLGLLAAHPAEPAPADEWPDELDPFVAEQLKQSPEFREAYAAAVARETKPAPIVTDEPLIGLYDDTRTLTIQGSINHEVSIKLGDEDTFFTWAEDLLAAAQRAAYEADVAPRPLLDREAVAEHLNDGWPYLLNDGVQYSVADAVLELARPMPTREQIERKLRERLLASSFVANIRHEPVRTQTVDLWVDLLADAVLTLLNGAES